MKVKLLYPPRLNDTDIHQFMPRLGIGLLYSFLKDNGIETYQDDLAIRCFNTKNLLRRKVNLRVFKDETRLDKYLKGKHDNYLESVIDKILSLTDHSGYDVIGFSITETYQYFVSLCLAKRLKETYKGKGRTVHIVFGGPTITLKREFTLKNYSFIDFEIHGDGEESFLRLINHLDKCGPVLGDSDQGLMSIPNLSYRITGSVTSTSLSEITRDNIPIPRFDGLPLELYKRKGILVLPYNFTRGCIAKCAFCTHRALSKSLRVKKVSVAIDEIKSLAERYDTRYFMFCENSINVSNSFIGELCDSIKDNNLDIMWMTWARPEKLTRELIKDMRKAGCIKLDFGIESGSQKVLDLIDKGFDVQDMQRVIRNTSEAGIWVHGSFIVNFTNESETEFNETVDFVKRNVKYLDSMEVNIFSLNQGSYVSLNPKRYGIKEVKDAIGPGLGMSYSTEDKDSDTVDNIGFNRLVQLRDIRFQNMISKIIDPLDIFEAFSRLRDKEEAKRYLRQESKYPILR